MLERIVSEIELLVTPSSSPSSVSEIVEGILRRDHAELAAYEKSGKLTPRVLQALQRKVEEAEADGVDLWFVFNSSSPTHIQGPCFIEPRDPPAVQVAKTNRLNRAPLRPIISSLTAIQFESLCVGLLGLLGARDYAGTKRSRDQGIDFYGRLVIGDLDASTSPFFRMTDHLSVWLVGQAKHYPGGKVSSPEIRDLVGSINLARFKEYASTNDLMKALPLRSCDPVFALFLTTGTYSRDAIKLANGSGVVIKNLDDICALLADNRVGIDAMGQITEQAVHEWIARRGELGQAGAIVQVAAPA